MGMEPLRGGMLAANLPAEVKQVYARAPVQRSAAEWALRWVWNHPEVTVVLSGMNDEGHIAENLKTAEDAYPRSLTEEELSRIAQVRDTYGRLMKVGCTGCSYCMPCPAGVDIPQNFRIYQRVKLFEQIDLAKWWWRRLKTRKEGDASALACKKCGKCLAKCPNGIRIVEQLAEVAAIMEK